jgi:hypothetical protein
MYKINILKYVCIQNILFSKYLFQLNFSKEKKS